MKVALTIILAGLGALAGTLTILVISQRRSAKKTADTVSSPASASPIAEPRANDDPINPTTPVGSVESYPGGGGQINPLIDQGEQLEGTDIDGIRSEGLAIGEIISPANTLAGGVAAPVSNIATSDLLG